LEEKIMSWYILELKVAEGELVGDSWQLAWVVSRGTGEDDPGNAIFQKQQPGRGIALYFSPSARLLAETFGAKPSAKPSPAGMTLVAGDDRAWTIHFADLSQRPAMTSRFPQKYSSRHFARTEPSRLFATTEPIPLP
jgi:hypothetical protein